MMLDHQNWHSNTNMYAVMWIIFSKRIVSSMSHLCYVTSYVAHFRELMYDTRVMKVFNFIFYVRQLFVSYH
jgi:hypothetical protein